MDMEENTYKHKTMTLNSTLRVKNAYRVNGVKTVQYQFSSCIVNLLHLM